MKKSTGQEISRLLLWIPLHKLLLKLAKQEIKMQINNRNYVSRLKLK